MHIQWPRRFFELGSSSWRDIGQALRSQGSGHQLRDRDIHTSYVATAVFVLLLAHRLYCRPNLSFSISLPRRNSDPGSLRRLFSPLPTTVGDFVFTAKKSSYFFPRWLASSFAYLHSPALSAVDFFDLLFLWINSKVRPTWDSYPRATSTSNSI